MKKCPVCEKIYGDSVITCEVDESALTELPPANDRYIGQTLKGHFRVIDKLGDGGGMGALYLAERIDVRRIVALKIFSPQYANDPEFVERFQREARLAASLNHPNIVAIYDIDRFADGSLFIAMEYLQGKELREVIKQERPLNIAKAVRYAIQIAEGLEAAHRAGLTHRGIKPQNIMVLNHGDSIKLLNFGIASSTEPNAAVRATPPNVTTATPEYISPEQVKGDPTSDHTDIYALGVVLYEMLTGTVPFNAPTPAAVLAKQLNEMPQPLRTLRREIPTSLEQLTMQALEKKVEDRQRNIAEVIEELKNAAASLDARQSSKSSAADMPTGLSARLKMVFGSWKAGGVTAGIVILALAGAYYWLDSEREPVATDPVTSTSTAGRSQDTKTEAQAREQNAEKERQARLQEESAKQAAQRAEEAERRQAEEKSRLAAELEQRAKDERLATIEKEKAERELARRQAEKTEKLRKQAEAERIAREQAKLKQAEQKPQTLAKGSTLSAADLARIRNQIDQKLRSNGLLKASESDRSGLSFDVSPAGIVTLTGTLRDQKLKGEVSRLVGEVAGVAEVRQNVQISLPERDDQSVEIRSQIEQKLRNSGLLKVSDSDRWGLMVNVTGGGIVTLTGVLRDQKLRFEAVRLTREVPGVSDVRQNIRVTASE